MRSRVKFKWLLDHFRVLRWICFLPLLTSPPYLLGGVTVTPKYLFLDSSARSTPITVVNPGDKPVEVWVEAKFGYVASDDSGKPFILYDSSAGIRESAAKWVVAYPQRFILQPNQSQIVRLTVTPPTGLGEGEYWARIIVASQNQRSAEASAKTGTGLTLVQAVGVAFHYRVGTLTTGVDVRNINVESNEHSIDVAMDMVRIGNASYWGMLEIRLVGQNSRSVLTSRKEIVVYKTYDARFVLDRSTIPPGTYTLEMKFSTNGRRGIKNLIQAQPLTVSKTVILN
jgi:hypothetical protein